jgi:O-antigen/teichoic acid export membrane protein
MPEDIPGSLKSRTVLALKWSLVQELAGGVVQFVLGIVLARLLLPQHYGLIGMLGLFLAVAQVFLDSGLGAALIQKKQLTETDTCSIFYFNLVVGLVVAVLLCLAAPWIAVFYGQPLLVPLTRVLSLSFVINAFSLVQTALLMKLIDFKTLTKVNLVSSVCSGCIGVVMAFRGWGVWSLAAQQVSNSAIRTALLWVFNSWRPSWLFSFGALRGLFAFSSPLLISALINEMFANIYLVVIGKTFSAADLGFYTRAQGLTQICSETLGRVANRVTYPVFSSVQTDRARLKRGLQRSMTSISFIHFPMMIGLAVTAKPLVLLLLTEKWERCIPYVQLLCLVGLLFPCHLLNLNVLTAVGRSGLFLRLEIIKKALVLVNIALTWRWGIEAMIWGQVVLSVIAYYLNTFYLGRLIDYSMREQMRDLFPYFAAAAVMGFAVYAVGVMVSAGNLGQLLVRVPVGMATYVLLCRAFSLTAFDEAWLAFRSKVSALGLVKA